MSFSALIRPFGVDIFCVGKKFLVYNMVSRNLKVKYRRSVLGVLWTLVSPLSLAAVYYFVFQVVMQVKVPNYIAYLASGIFLWNFVSQTISEGLDAFLGNASLITKIPVPLQIFPYVGMVTNLVTLILSVPVMLGISLASGATIGWSLIALPFYMGAIAVIAYSITIVLALAHVFFRDLKHMINILIQLWFYATPVIYRVEMIPEKFRLMLFVNPLGSPFVAAHQILVEGQWPPLKLFAVTCGWTAVLTFASLLIFRSMQSTVAENL